MHKAGVCVLFKIDSKILAKCIDKFCKDRAITKGDFHKESLISSATLTQWRHGAEVSPKSVSRLEDYTGMAVEEFVSTYSGESVSDIPEDTAYIREMLRTRPEVKILFDTVKDAPASVLLEVAARILRMKEESEKQ